MKKLRKFQYWTKKTFLYNNKRVLQLYLLILNLIIKRPIVQILMKCIQVSLH